MKSEGLLIVISGPSGVGKGTVCASLLEQLETLYRAGLYTTEEYRKKKEEILRGK